MTSSTPVIHSELVAAAVAMARDAGRILLNMMNASFDVAHKSAIDLVTSADHASEASILRAIRHRFPTHAILSEESGHLHGATETHDPHYRWIVDPLDGTVNFAHRIPQFCVLIGIQERQADQSFRTIVGITFDPIRDEMYIASRGEGATLNGKPIRVSNTSQLIDSVGCTGFGYKRLQANHQDNHAEFCRLNLVTQGVRRLGAAGLDLAYLAAGRLDYFWEYDLHLWDVVPGALLLEEAGGCITHLDPHQDASAAEPFTAARAVYPADELCHVIASNRILQQQLHAVIQSAHAYPVNDRRGLDAFLPAHLRSS